MYVVIFKAEINKFDDEYSEMAKRMRDLAINEYGCLEFVSSTEGNLEIAISSWANQDQIKAWRNNTEHLSAQSNGKNKWYKSYTVQVAEVVRAYSSNT